jgi:hypothetical protein
VPVRDAIVTASPLLAGRLLADPVGIMDGTLVVAVAGPMGGIVGASVDEGATGVAVRGAVTSATESGPVTRIFSVFGELWVPVIASVMMAPASKSSATSAVILRTLILTPIFIVLNDNSM